MVLQKVQSFPTLITISTCRRKKNAVPYGNLRQSSWLCGGHNAVDGTDKESVMRVNSGVY